MPKVGHQSGAVGRAQAGNLDPAHFRCLRRLHPTAKPTSTSCSLRHSSHVNWEDNVVWFMWVCGFGEHSPEKKKGTLKEVTPTSPLAGMG